jgi:hypothetical protein
MVARRIFIWNLEGLFKMDGNRQTSLGQDMPRAAEVGRVGLWVLGGCDNPSVCMQISTTAFPRRKKKRSVI